MKILELPELRTAYSHFPHPASSNVRHVTQWPVSFRRKPLFFALAPSSFENKLPIARPARTLYGLAGNAPWEILAEANGSRTHLRRIRAPHAGFDDRALRRQRLASRRILTRKSTSSFEAIVGAEYYERPGL